MAKTLIGNVKGKDGRGIANISKTGTTGSVDTYTIRYTDGTTSTYTVNNSDSVALQRQIVPSAAVESSTTASQAYVAGDFLVVNGVLRRVTGSISKGSAISDSNSVATNVGDEIKGISSALATLETVDGWTVVHLSPGVALLVSQVTFKPSSWTEWGRGAMYSNLKAAVSWPVTVKGVIYCDAEVQYDTGNSFCDAYLNAPPTTSQFPPFYVTSLSNDTSLETTVTVQRVALVRTA